MRKQCILSVVGTDRTGILAELTEVIYRCNGNIEDSRMALFGFLFGCLMQISVRSDQDLERLKAEYEGLEVEKGIQCAFFTFESGMQRLGDNSQPDPDYQIRVRGGDKAGIVYRTAAMLASFNINILSLQTRVDRSQEPAFMDMCLQVSVPWEMDTEKLRNNLGFLAQELNESITLSRFSPSA